ncbi:glycosyltransferase [Nisaea sp.]|uniref:glycosyltransferase n=1 Tax=Nisaea sp. TaxID=2024842 RepID=UPI003B523B6F
MSLKISVYVPCYNAERTIGACLASLIAQVRKPDEILVIDDGSKDRTLKIAKRYPGVRIVQHAVNKGLATARNTGVRFTKGDLIASIDSDCAADPHWLRILAEEMERSPDLCGVAGAVNETERGTIADRWRTYHMRQHYGQSVVENPRFLFGANTVFRRSALEAAGRYPPVLRTNGEDFEICRKIYAKIPDAKLRYLPSAYVHHLRRDTFKSIANAYWRYQTYVSWARPHQRSIARTLRQTMLCLGLVWGAYLPWDFRNKQHGAIWISLYITAVLPWLQFRQHMDNRAKVARLKKMAESSRTAAPGN